MAGTPVTVASYFKKRVLKYLNASPEGHKDGEGSGRQRARKTQGRRGALTRVMLSVTRTRSNPSAHPGRLESFLPPDGRHEDSR